LTEEPQIAVITLTPGQVVIPVLTKKLIVKELLLLNSRATVIQRKRKTIENIAQYLHKND